MGANQKYSGRIHTKRQLGRAVEHIQATALVLAEIQQRYIDASPVVSEACRHMIGMMSLTENMLEDIKDSL